MANIRQIGADWALVKKSGKVVSVHATQIAAQQALLLYKNLKGRSNKSRPAEATRGRAVEADPDSQQDDPNLNVNGANFIEGANQNRANRSRADDPGSPRGREQNPLKKGDVGSLQSAVQTEQGWDPNEDTYESDLTIGRPRRASDADSPSKRARIQSLAGQAPVGDAGRALPPGDPYRQGEGGPDGQYSNPMDPAGDNDFLKMKKAQNKKGKLDTVRRYDVGELAKPIKLDNGWLRCEGILTRTGVFQYRNMDGSIRRELRLPEEVFAKDALKSLSLVPLTDDHPDVGFLDASNAQQYAVGSVGEVVRKDGETVKAEMLITNETMVAKLDARQKSQLSCGYFADLEPASGEWHGQKYDAIQRNIRGNHVAIVDVARAGPEAKIRLDSFSGVMVASNTGENDSQGTTEMNKKIRIDGVDFEVTEPVAQAYANKKDAYKKSIDKLEKQIAKEQARADAAEESLKAAQESLKAANDPAALREKISARVAIETQARSVLGSDVRLDTMSEREIRVAVLSKMNKNFKADGKSDEYVSARFDIAIETAQKSDDALSGVRQTIVDSEKADGEKVVLGADAARAKFMKETRNDWKKPLSAVAPGFKA